MDKSNRKEAFKTLIDNEEEVIVEIMRGDSEKTSEEEAEPQHSSNIKIKRLLDELGNESFGQRVRKLYRNHFRGRLLRTLAVIMDRVWLGFIMLRS